MGNLPHICIMMDGLLQRWFELPTRVQSVIMAISITGNMVPYRASFYYRHQVVMPPGSRWNLNYTRGFSIWIGYICAMIASNSTWIYFMPIPEETNHEYVETNFGNWSVSFRSRITCYGEDSMWFARAAVLYIHMCLSFMTITSIHIFYTIANHRTISRINHSTRK
ncbi:hypothetical protein PRIPAC_82846 [Pristionchus pacificus]|nr:hypothetical protein PRIPAC_82846 [Pristionchus pacificus]